MRQRLLDQEETRQRIVEAAVQLHGTVGPAATTIAGIAEEAGVQRSTVYRHFPDDETLFAACSGHFVSLNPFPDPSLWAAFDNPAERLTAALGDLYAYYSQTSTMMGNIHRDIASMPESVATGLSAQMELMVETLLRGWSARGARRRRLQAVLAHAVAFPTFKSLTDAGLAPDEAAETMTSMVASLAPSPGG